MKQEAKKEQGGRKAAAILKHLRGNYCYYLSFLVVVVIMIAVMVAEKVEPFGTHSLTLVDSLHQYLPFYSEYRDKLLTARGLTYSFNVALGSNFSSLFAYYLSSPFNLILTVLPKGAMIVAVNLTMVLKIALCAVTMAYMLIHLGGKKRTNPIVIGISLFYALSNYMIGYFWNTMWLDTIMMLPLIILGFERLMEEGKPLLYTLSLAYALFCNYYIAFMICIFLVLWFLLYSHKSVKKFFVGGLRFALYSITAAGLAAAVLIPAYFGIKTTASGDTKNIVPYYESGIGKLLKLPKHEWYGDIWNLLKQQLFLTKPITNQTFDGGVNLYCGVIVIVTSVLFIIGTHTTLWAKIRYAVLMVIFAVSFNEVCLNYIWHGLHDQYGIPNRFSFLMIFVLLLGAYKILVRIPFTEAWYPVVAMIPAAAYIIMLQVRNQKTVTQPMLMGSIIFMIIYVGIMMFGALRLMPSRRINRSVYSWMLTVTMLVELVISSVNGFSEIGYTDYGDRYSTYPEMQATVDYLERYAESNNQTFYRAEVAKHRVLDEVTWYNLPSISTFNSTVGGALVTFMGRIGFYTGANEFLYMGSTFFTNSILGVRYLLVRNGDLNNFDFNYLDNPCGVEIYENPYPLSVAFAVNEQAKTWDSSYGTPFTRIQNLANMMTAEPYFFRTITPELTSESTTMNTTGRTTDVTVTAHQAGKADFTTSFIAPEDGDYYINCRGNYTTKIRFYIDGVELSHDRYQLQIFHLGELYAGQEVKVQYEYDSVDTNPIVAHFDIALFDRALYEQTYAKLSQCQLEVTEFTDGHVKGHIDMPEGRTLFTSIPYDEGWTLKVDGKKADYYKFADALIGIDLTPGYHEIELKYRPKGLSLGLLATFICAAFLILRTILVKKTERLTAEKNRLKKQKQEVDFEDGV